MMFSVASFVSYVFCESSWHRYDHLVLSQTTHNFWRMSRKAGTAFFTIIGQIPFLFVQDASIFCSLKLLFPLAIGENAFIDLQMGCSRPKI